MNHRKRGWNGGLLGQKKLYLSSSRLQKHHEDVAKNVKWDRLEVW